MNILYIATTIFIGSILPCALLYPQSAATADCTRATYTRCVSLADPLLKDAALIFPDNMRDIELVCVTWNSFVDCLKAYTDRCFTREQRRQFNKAVENPIESVHMMCTQQHYQQEYLIHASCIKSTVTEHQHCGNQYSQLVDQVSQGDAISRASLCCSHDRFRKCVMSEAMRMCDGGNPNGNAVRFAEQIIDKALSFLQDQCFNYIPNSGDCLTVSYKISDDQLAMSTSPWFNTRGRDLPLSPSSPSHTVQIDLTEPLNTNVTVVDFNEPTNNQGSFGSSLSTADDLGAGRNTAGVPDGRVTDGGWVPNTGNLGDGAGNTATMLGSRTRPSSYGRSSGWDTTPNTDVTPSSRPDWATVSTWHVYTGGSNIGYSVNNENSNTRLTTPPTKHDSTNLVYSTTTETWYPAAGSHVGNEVDEPNQQGLAKPKNTAPKHVIAVELSFTVVATVLVAYC